MQDASIDGYNYIRTIFLAEITSIVRQILENMGTNWTKAPNFCADY